MNFLGMGAMEIVVIMIVALIIFGPERLPEMGAQAGKALRDLRNMTREVTGDFEESITDVRSVMDEMKTTVADVQRETRDLATSVTEIADSAASEVRAGVKSVNDETAKAAAVAKPDLISGPPKALVEANKTGAKPAATNGVTKVPASKPAAARPAVEKSVKPTKKDPLADLGGFGES